MHYVIGNVHGCYLHLMALLTVMEEKCSDAKMIILTSPTYYGVCQNIKKASSIAHESGMLIMVDESYGAHFTFSKSSPETALECGADIVVHSLSKTLGGFKGSGLLHIAESVDKRTLSTIEANLEIYEGERASSAFLCASENISSFIKSLKEEEKLLIPRQIFCGLELKTDWDAI